MFSITKRPHPNNTLIRTYRDTGAYVDCYTTDIPGDVNFPDYITAFYTTFLFKMERFLIKWFVCKPSTDAEAKRLAAGELNTFSAWYVETRDDNQLLMCDYQKRTRSWFMLKPTTINGKKHTRLYFGTAVVPLNNDKYDSVFSLTFRLLVGLHKAYAVLLLYFAKSRLQRKQFR